MWGRNEFELGPNKTWGDTDLVRNLAVFGIDMAQVAKA